MNGKTFEKRIEVPDDVHVEISGKKVIIKGPKGAVEKAFDDPRFSEVISLEKSGSSLAVIAHADGRKVKSVSGTIAAHISNMIKGVSKGYAYTMKVFYTHFPITVAVKDREVQIRNFVGEKGARRARIIGNAEVKVGKDELEIAGASVEDVGQTAANIEQACKLPRRDRRIFQDGIYLTGRKLQTGENL